MYSVHNDHCEHECHKQKYVPSPFDFYSRLCLHLFSFPPSVGPPPSTFVAVVCAMADRFVGSVHNVAFVDTLEGRRQAMAADAASQQASEESPFGVEEDERHSEKPKHAFVHISMHPDWVKYPLALRVNKRSEISVDGGPWHGSALYDNPLGRGRWRLHFDYKADMAYSQELTFLHIPGTLAYMNVQESAWSYNAILITKTEGIAV